MTRKHLQNFVQFRRIFLIDFRVEIRLAIWLQAHPNPPKNLKKILFKVPIIEKTPGQSK